MSNIEQTITISLPDNHKKDELVECMMFLRLLARNYPQQLDIAYEALRQEQNRLLNMAEMTGPETV
jgi:hypothetical protein